MNYLQRLRNEHPVLAQFSDEDIINYLPTYDPETFGGLNQDQLIYAATNDDSQFTKGVKGSVDQVQAMGGGLLATVGDIAGAKDLKDYGMQVYTDNMKEAEQYRPNVAGFTDIESLGDAGDWAAYTAGNLIPTMGATILGGGVGGAVAKQVGKKTAEGLLKREIAKGASVEAAKNTAGKHIAKSIGVGQGVGAFATSAGMQTGSIYGDTEDPEVAFAHGAVAGAFDAMPIARVLGKFGLAGAAKEQVQRSVVGEIAKQGTFEAGTEALQTLVEQHAKYWVENNGESLLANLGEVNTKEIIDAAAAGALGGSIMGAGTGLATRKPMEDADARIRKAGEDAAASGGDALDQANAQAAEATNLASAVSEQNEIDSLETARQRIDEGQLESATFEQSLPEQQDRPTASHRDMSGLDGLITTAERMGFTDEAAMLIRAKNVFKMAERARAAGNEKMAGVYAQRGNHLYREATETNEQVREISNQFPVPFVSQGEVVGGDIVTTNQAQPEGNTYDAEQPTSAFPGRNQEAISHQPNINRLQDQGIIYGEEPADVTQARAQREADHFAAMYGQEGDTPFSASTPVIEGELDRSNELPDNRFAQLPPGTGQIELGQSRPERQFEPVSDIYEGVGQNIVERQAQRPKMLESANPLRALTPEQIRYAQELSIEALTIPRDLRTEEQQQAIEIAASIDPLTERTIKGIAEPSRQKKQYTREPDPENDDLLAAIALGGGIRRDFAEGVDPADYSRRAAGIRYVFPKSKGRSLDDMAEYLRQFGYVNTVEELQAKLDNALRGEKVMTPEGAMRQLEREEKEAAKLEQDIQTELPETTQQEGWSAIMGKEAFDAGVPLEKIQQIIDEHSDNELHIALELKDEIYQLQAERGETGASLQGNGGAYEESFFPESESATPESIWGEEEPELLTSYTEADLKAKEQREQDQRAAEEAEDKAFQHSSVDNFTLGTSQGHAGEQLKPAVSGGSGDMFASPSTNHQAKTDQAKPVSDQANKKSDQANQATIKQSEIPVDPRDHLDQITERFSNGEVTPIQEIKDLFERVIAQPDEIKTDLNKLTKKQLTNLISGHVYADEKKARLVDRAYSSLVGRFRFIGHMETFVTHTSHTLEGKIEDTRKHLDSLTESKLAEYAEAEKARTDERNQRFEKLREQLKDPRSLEDFETFIQYKGAKALSDAQRAEYDRLKTEKEMADKPVTKQGLRTEDEVELGEPVEAKHGKTGETIFNVAVVTRLGKDKFKEAATFARSMGGGYWRGNFHFKSREDAELFSGWINGNEVDLTERNAAKAAKKKGAASDRLKAMADRLESAGNESLNADRRENTHRQMDQADHARKKAEGEIRMAKILRIIAESENPILKKISEKVQIELLDGLVNQLKYNVPQSDRDALTYVSGPGHLYFKDEVPAETRVKYAKMPFDTSWTRNLTELANKMTSTKGFALAGRHYLKRAESSDDQVINIASGPYYEKLREFVKKHTNKYDGSRSRLADRERLERMGVNSTSALRAALVEYIAITKQADSGSSQNKLNQLERDLKRTVVGNRNAYNDFFPTPKNTASEIIDLADIQPGMKVLEPSAGNGMLADAARDAGASVDVVELGSKLRDILEEKGHNLVGSDFTEFESGAEYDRIVMNPPFSTDQDIDHTLRAYEMLKPGGRLVSITSSMAGERQNKKNKQFKEWLEDLSAEEQALPEGAFKSSLNPTAVRAKVIIIDKPGDGKFSRYSEGLDTVESNIASQYPDVKLSISQSGDRATIHKIIVPKDQRNQGIGRHIMAQIAGWADKSGITLTLTPSSDFGGSVSRLKQFYKSMGFVENKGRNKDFEISESMLRLPGSGAYSRQSNTNANPRVEGMTPAANQSEARKLNDYLADGLNERYRDAFNEYQMPDSMSEFSEAVQGAFGQKVSFIAAPKKGNTFFNGFHSPWGTIYVNPTTDVSFIATTGHELYHEIAKKRPDLHQWLVGKLRSYVQNREEYRAKLDSMLQPGEQLHSDSVIDEELLADLMGDAFIDPGFMKTLRDDNVGYFKRLTNIIHLFLQKVSHKLKGLGSDKYFNDVEGARTHLRAMIKAFNEGNSVEDIQTPDFSGEGAFYDSRIESQHQAFVANMRSQAGQYAHAGSFSRAVEHEDLNQTQEAFLNKIGPETPIQSIKHRIAEVMDNWRLKLRQGVVDRYAPLYEIDKKAHGDDVIETGIQDSSWVLARMASSAEGALSAMLNFGRIKYDDNVIDVQEGTEGLIDTLKKLGDSKEIERFMGWIAANRAQKLMEQGRENLFTAEEIEAAIQLNQGRTAEGLSRAELYEQVFEEFQQHRDDVLSIADKAGLLRKGMEEDQALLFLAKDNGINKTLQMKVKNARSAMNRAEDGDIQDETQARYNRFYAELRDEVSAALDDFDQQMDYLTTDQRELWANEFYVPFYRVMEDEAVKGPVASGGISRQEAYKKLKGGTQNVNDLLGNTLMNFNHLISASLKNIAAKQALENAESIGAAEVTTENRRDKKASTFVMKDGVKVWYNVEDPLVYRALISLTDSVIKFPGMGLMRGFKRVFTNFTTASPQFIVANLIRDSLQATATSEVSYNVAGNVAEGMRKYGVFNKMSPTRARMIASGGAFSFGHVYGDDAETIKVRINGELRKASVIKEPAQALKMFRVMWDKYHDVSDSFENVNRAALFEQNYDRGKLYAAFKSRDLMDFSVRGAHPLVNFFVDVVPFLNARLQGLDKLYRSGVKPAARVLKGEGNLEDKQAAARFAAVTGALTMATIALYLHNRDDEDYEALEDWQKDTYWFVKVGDDAFFIPKPFEVGAIATLAERGIEQMVDDEANAELFLERLGHMVGDTFSFNPIPQMFRPLVDVQANTDSFTGRPIESMGMDRLSPSLRYRDSTTSGAKWISYGLENTAGALFGADSMLVASPVEIDYMINNYFGWLGSSAASIVDVVAKTAQGKPSPEKAWSEYQPFRRFYRDLNTPGYTKHQTQFYENLKEVNRIYADVKKLRELGQDQEAQDIYLENKDKLRHRKLMNRVQRKLTAINNRMKMIRRSNLSPEIMRKRLDVLQVQKNKLTHMVSQRVSL